MKMFKQLITYKQKLHIPDNVFNHVIDKLINDDMLKEGEIPKTVHLFKTKTGFGVNVELEK